MTQFFGSHSSKRTGNRDPYHWYGSAARNANPCFTGMVRKTHRKDKDGNRWLPNLNEPMLEQISAAGGGIYVRANNAQVGFKCPV